MKRNVLIPIVKSAVEKLGYAFYSGRISLPARISVFPAVWLKPLQVVGEEGRRECRITYKVCAVFMMTVKNERDVESALKMLEEDSLAIFHELNEDREIQQTSRFRCTPSELSHTKYGECSIEVEFNVEMCYYR